MKRPKVVKEERDLHHARVTAFCVLFNLFHGQSLCVVGIMLHVCLIIMLCLL